MKLARRRKPYDPGDIQAERNEIARLKTVGADVNVDDRTGRLLSAKRSNVFTALHSAGSLSVNQYNASVIMMELWARWKGLEGSSGSEKVDGGSGSAELVNDRMIKAGCEVDRVMDQLSPLDRRLLEALMVQLVECRGFLPWRNTVAAITNVRARDAQSVPVVTLCENLRLIFEGVRA